MTTYREAAESTMAEREQRLRDDLTWCLLPTRAFGDKSLTEHAGTIWRILAERDHLRKQLASKSEDRT